MTAKSLGTNLQNPAPHSCREKTHSRPTLGRGKKSCSHPSEKVSHTDDNRHSQRDESRGVLATPQRTAPKRRLARVLSDFFAPLRTPTFSPPIWMFSPLREGGACGSKGSSTCFVFFSGILLFRRCAFRWICRAQYSQFQATQILSEPLQIYRELGVPCGKQ